MTTERAGRRVRVFQTLGKGSYGTVFVGDLTTDEGLQRRVAIKVLNASVDDPEHEKRHRDEARLLALLDHENIVKVYDILRFQGRAAFMLEFVDGVNAELLVSRSGALPPRAALEVGVAVARALEYAYSGVNPTVKRPLKVIHRDVKPANILISARGGVKVLDFGVARADFERSAHTQDQALGTLAFMAPECFVPGERLGPGLDVFALGMTLVRLLSGIQPTHLPSGQGYFDAPRDDLLAQVRTRLPRGVWAEELVELLRSMLAWSPEQRPVGAVLVDAISSLEDDAPGERLLPYVRRAVPPLVEDQERRARENRDQPPMELTLSAGGDVQPVEERKPRQSSSRWPLIAIGLFVAVALIVTVAVSGLAWMASREAGEPSEPPPTSGETVVDNSTRKRSGAPPAAPAAQTPSAETTASAQEEPRKPTSGSTSKKAAPTVSSAPATSPCRKDSALPTQTMTFHSRPLGAEVWVDGVSLGITPILGCRVAEGSHKLAMKAEDGKVYQRTINVGELLSTKYTLLADGTWSSEL